MHVARENDNDGPAAARFLRDFHRASVGGAPGGSQQFGSAKLAAVVALDRLLMLTALVHSRPSSSSTAARAFT
jgi:hypothetical protein